MNKTLNKTNAKAIAKWYNKFKYTAIGSIASVGIDGLIISPCNEMKADGDHESITYLFNTELSKISHDLWDCGFISIPNTTYQDQINTVTELMEWAGELAQKSPTSIVNRWVTSTWEFMDKWLKGKVNHESKQNKQK